MSDACSSVAPPPRVLVYSAASPTEEGGVQKVVRRLSGELRSRGFQVKQGWASSSPMELDALRAPLRWSQAPLGPLACIPSFVGLARALLKLRPQIVNVHFVTGQALYFILLRKLFGFKTILSVHGSDLLRPREHLGLALPFMLRRADAVTVVSEDLRQRLLLGLGLDPRKVRYVPNGVDVDFWADAQRDLPRLALAAPHLVTVGRLEPVKGLDVLLQAFWRVRRNYPDARLTIVGEGEARAALERQAALLGIEAGVTFAGRLAREGIRELFGGAHLFALPSRSEGMPLALLEAMAAGLPVVASTVGGVREVVGDEAGLLVRSGVSEPLATAILHLLGEPALAARMGAAAAERVRERYSSAASTRAFESVLREVSILV